MAARGIFRPRARYFPGMESTQRSPGLRARTQSARLGRTPNLFGAGMNLGPLRSPPAAARSGQIRWSFFSHIAPLVCLAFSPPLGVARWGRFPPIKGKCPAGAKRVGLIGPKAPVRRARRPGASSSQSTLHSERPGVGIPRTLPCSSSPQRDRWRWVTLGTPNGHLPPWVGKACWVHFIGFPPQGGSCRAKRD